MVQRFQAEDETTGQQRQRTRVSSEHRYPIYDLNDAIEVAQTIRDRGGGASTRDQLAAFLGYSSTNNGAFLSRLSAARLFGVVGSSGRELVPTELATRMLNPEWPDDAAEARVEAFLNVPLYRAIYQRYEGQQLPPEVGLRNALRTFYEVPESRTATAYRVLMDSADQAGFFAARGGSRTHLIQPSTRAREATATSAQEPESEEGGGDGGGMPPTPPPRTDTEQVRLEYVRKLISMIGSDQVEDQVELMRRIEKLLGENSID